MQVKVRDNPNYVKDLRTGAVLNTNHKERIVKLNMKNKSKELDDKMKTLDEKIAQLGVLIAKLNLSV